MCIITCYFYQFDTTEKMFIVGERTSIHLFDEIIISKYFLSPYLLWYLIGSNMFPSGSVFHPVSHGQR